jgi:hypothetical protein
MNKIEEFDQKQDLVYVQLDMHGCHITFDDKEEIIPIGSVPGVPPLPEDPLVKKWEEEIAKGHHHHHLALQPLPYL